MAPIHPGLGGYQFSTFHYLKPVLHSTEIHMPDGKFPMSGPALPTIPVQFAPTFNTHSPQAVSIDFGAKPSAVVPDFGNVDIFKGQFVQQMGLGGSQFGGKGGFCRVRCGEVWGCGVSQTDHWRGDRRGIPEVRKRKRRRILF